MNDFTIPTGETIRGIVREEIRNGIAEMLEKNEKKQRYFSRIETAEQLKMSLPTLHKNTKKGLIKCSKIGGRVLYTGEAIEQAIQLLSK